MDCNYNFITRDISFKSPYPKHLIIKAIKLWGTNKGYVNKFDHLKKTTYSLREIQARTGMSQMSILKRIKFYEMHKMQ